MDRSTAKKLSNRGVLLTLEWDRVYLLTKESSKNFPLVSKFSNFNKYFLATFYKSMCMRQIDDKLIDRWIDRYSKTKKENINTHIHEYKSPVIP